jgi:hypothetical protein
MNTSSLRAGARTFVKITAMAGAVSLALAAACGGGAAASPSYGAMTHGAKQGYAMSKSTNWAGYVIRPGRDVDDVSGEWTIPAVNCQQTPNALDAVWAGIGGVVSGQHLLQTGVSDSCKGGVQRHYAWWELYPGPSVNLGLIVYPGDRMQASVYLSQEGHWVTRIDNLTTGWSGWMISGETYGVGRDGSGSFTREGYASSVSFAGGSTVEWVVERPKVAGASIPIADFGRVQFSGLRTGLQRWSLNADESEELMYDDRAVAVPGLPYTDGFSVSYTG